MNKHFVSKHRLNVQKTAGTFIIAPGEYFVIQFRALGKQYS